MLDNQKEKCKADKQAIERKQKERLTLYPNIKRQNHDN